MNVAQSLVRGSDNMNKMRSDIERVITMVLSLVDNNDIEKYVNFDDQGATNFQSPDCDWILRWEVGRKNPGISAVSCYLVEDSGTSSKRVLLFNVSQDLRIILKTSQLCHLDKVQRVYEVLPVFVDGMLKTFPYLAERLEPFFKASKVDI